MTCDNKHNIHTDVYMSDLVISDEILENKQNTFKVVLSVLLLYKKG